MNLLSFPEAQSRCAACFVAEDSKGTAADFAVIVELAGAFRGGRNDDFEVFPAGRTLDEVGIDLAEHEW